LPTLLTGVNFYRYSSCSCSGDALKKRSLQLSVVSNRIFDTTSYVQDSGHDAISRIKVLPSGECTILSTVPDP